MTFPLATRIAPVAVLAAFVLVLTACSRAAPYEFVTATPDVAMGETVVDVQLKNTAAGTLVSDAIISATRLDMAPDNMAGMKSTIEPQVSDQPGVYRFKANFSMTGTWALSVSAKVPGQAQPINGTVVFKAK